MGLFSKPKPPTDVYVLKWRDTFEFDVVGESYRRDHLERVIAAAPPEQQDRGEVYTLAVLEREPTNPHDPNAVRVLIDGGLVGYIPRDVAGQIGAFVKRTNKAGGVCGVRARIGWAGYSGAPIGVQLDMPHPRDGNTDVELVPLAEVADRITTPPPRPVSRRESSAHPVSPEPRPVTDRERAKFGALLAEAVADPPTLAKIKRLASLADDLGTRCLDLLDEDDVTVDDVADLLRAHGLDPGTAAAFVAGDPRDALGDLEAAATDLYAQADGAVDEWPDADADERRDLRDDVSSYAEDLLGLLTARDAPAPVAPAAAALPPAGWYPNPEAPGQRYWDGTTWTEHTAR